MILIGASGHAKVIIDILEKSGEPVDYLVDANADIHTLSGKKVVPQNQYEPNASDELILSIGANAVRKRLFASFNTKYGKAIHPSVIRASNTSIGEGTVVMAGVVINPDTHIGRHCIINTTASIDHDCQIADFVHISPNATLCGTISVGEGAHVGAGATIIPNLNIGKWATIGAGAVVIADVPDYAVVVGNPARIIKYNEPKT